MLTAYFLYLLTQAFGFRNAVQTNELAKLTGIDLLELLGVLYPAQVHKGCQQDDGIDVIVARIQLTIVMPEAQKTCFQ